MHLIIRLLLQYESAEELGEFLPLEKVEGYKKWQVPAVCKFQKKLFV